MPDIRVRDIKAELNNNITGLVNRLDKIEFQLMSQRQVNESFTHILADLNSASTEIHQKNDYIRNVLWKYQDKIEECQVSIFNLSRILSEHDKINNINCKNQKRRNWMRGKKKRR